MGLRVLGFLLTVAGLVFALQGVGLVSGSVMTGEPLWVVLGPLIAATGLLLLYRSVRGK